MIDGARLRTIRLRRGFSQATLGHLCHKDAQYISKLERGALPGANIQVLEQLVEALGCSADYLLGLEDAASGSGSGPALEPHPGAGPDDDEDAA